MGGTRTQGMTGMPGMPPRPSGPNFQQLFTMATLANPESPMDEMKDILGDMPMMGMNPMMGMGGMGMGAGAGSRGPSMTGFSGFGSNPYMSMAMMDLLNKPRPTLSSPRKTFIQPVVYPNGEVLYYPVSPVNEQLRQ